MKKKSNTTKRYEKLQSLTKAALGRYELNEIIAELCRQSNKSDFNEAAVMHSDNLIDITGEMEDIIIDLTREDEKEFTRCAMKHTNLIDKDCPDGNFIVLDMTGKGLNHYDKLENFLCSEIFPYVNEQQSQLFC